jgi:hypothetical protein
VIEHRKDLKNPKGNLWESKAGFAPVIAAGTRSELRAVLKVELPSPFIRRNINGLVSAHVEIGPQSTKLVGQLYNSGSDRGKGENLTGI